jgi:hypothetical protein
MCLFVHIYYLDRVVVQHHVKGGGCGLSSKSEKKQAHVTWGFDRTCQLRPTWQLCRSCSHATVKVLKHVRMVNARIEERDIIMVRYFVAQPSIVF